MTREEHIKAAEKLLAGRWLPISCYREEPTDRDIAVAQVHATLAAAMAATSEQPRPSWWRKAGKR